MKYQYIFLIYIASFLGKNGKTTFSKVLNALIAVKNTKKFHDIFTNSITVQHELFDFSLKILFNKRLAFPHMYCNFYRLMVTKITGYQECYFFFKLIKHVYFNRNV